MDYCFEQFYETDNNKECQQDWVIGHAERLVAHCDKSVALGIPGMVCLCREGPTGRPEVGLASGCQPNDLKQNLVMAVQIAAANTITAIAVRT